MATFAEDLELLRARMEKSGPALKTEEATKHALVLPFLSALGYDVFNPSEVVPEFIADVGEAKGEKVDYAVFSGKDIAMLVECKTYGANLDVKKANQLLRYFNTRDAKVGVLTNGDHYQFFTDLEKPNLMDQTPFLDIYLSSLTGAETDEIAKFCKDSFDIEDVLSSASELRYTRAIKASISAEWDNPSNGYVRYFVSDIYHGRMTERVREQFRAIVKRAVQSLLREKIEQRLHLASLPESEEAVEQDEAEVPGRTATQSLVFTDEELMGLNIVRAIAAADVDPLRVAERDHQSYCTVLLDYSRRRRICRLYFNSLKKHVGIYLADGSEETVELENVSDLYKYIEQLRARIRSLAGIVD